MFEVLLATESATWSAVLVEKVLIPVSTALGVALAGYVTVLVKRMTDKAGIELKKEQREQVDKAIEQSILHTMQTFTQQLKNNAADGHLSADDARQALLKAKDRAVLELKHLGKAANGEAKRFIYDSKLLEEKIESLLPIVKAKTERAKALTREEAKKIVRDLEGNRRVE